MTSIATCLDLPLCSYEEWLAKLDSRAVAETDADTLPALKFLDFFHTLTADVMKTSFGDVDCENAVAESSALRDAAQLTNADVKKWIGYWKDVNFLW